MPKTIGTQAAKQYRALGRAYEALAEVFENSLKEEESNQRLVAEANAGQEIWRGVSRLDFPLCYFGSLQTNRITTPVSCGK